LHELSRIDLELVPRLVWISEVRVSNERRAESDAPYPEVPKNSCEFVIFVSRFEVPEVNAQRSNFGVRN